MELLKVRGRTYYIPNVTNVGVYRYRNGYCLLVDSGIDNTTGRRVIELLEKENLRVKYVINTHSHADHIGANTQIKEMHPGTIVATSRFEKMFIENNLLAGMMLYGASPLPDLSSRFTKAKEISVDLELDPGTVKLEDKEFEIISLPGHTPGQIGVITEDNVIFCGDAFFSKEKLQKYRLPYLFDIDKQLKTLNYLLESEYDGYVIAHEDNRLADAKKTIKLNIENIKENIDLMLDFLAQPLTREDLTECIINEYKISMNITQYFITLTSTSAFLTYLMEKDAIDMDIIDGKIYFYVN